MPDLEVVPVTSPPRATWRAAGLDALAFHGVLLHLLRDSERPQAAAAVWSALILHTEADGSVRAQRGDLARTAMCSPADASRALTDLVRLGVIIRHGEGRASRYRINPDPSVTPPSHPRPAGQKLAETVNVVIARSEPAKPAEMKTVFVQTYPAKQHAPE
jgi:hypothetical protein